MQRWRAFGLGLVVIGVISYVSLMPEERQRSIEGGARTGLHRIASMLRPLADDLKHAGRSLTQN